MILILTTYSSASLCVISNSLDEFGIRSFSPIKIGTALAENLPHSSDLQVDYNIFGRPIVEEYTQTMCDQKKESDNQRSPSNVK